MELYFKIFFTVICGLPFVTSFSWSNCGTTSDPIKIMSLDVFSNQSGLLYATGRGKVAMNLTSPIEGKLDVQKKFFWGWTKVPCVDNVGSCTYDDVCTLSPYTNTPCPDEFIKNDLPCRCPVLQGQYAAKKLPIDLSVLPHWIEKGKYRIKFTLTKDEKLLMCILMYLNF